MAVASFFDLQNTMRVRHEALVTGISYQYDNEKQTLSGTSNHILLSVDWEESEPRSIGVGGYLIRKRGDLVARIHILVEDGAELALQKADLIKANFSQVTVDGVSYGTPHVGPVGVDDREVFWFVEVRTPFFSDTVFTAPARVTGTAATLEAVHDKVMGRFGTLVEDALSLSVLYDNAPTKNADGTPVIPTDGSQWIRLAVSTGQTHIGQLGTKKTYRTPGRFWAMIFSKTGIGDKSGMDTADTIDAAFRGVIDSGIHYSPCSLTAVGRSGAWFQHNLRAPFYFEANV